MCAVSRQRTCALLTFMTLALCCVLAIFAGAVVFAWGDEVSSSGSSSGGGDYEVATNPFADAIPADWPDGVYQIAVTLEGGSGKASIESPAEFEVFDGRGVARVVWSSEHYDYMVVAGKKYLPVNKEGNSTFVIPVTAYDEPMSIIGDTTAMGQAHEITYKIAFAKSSVKVVKAAGVAGQTSSDSASAQAGGFSWPWLVFVICALLSIACLVACVLLIRRYHVNR